MMGKKNSFVKYGQIRGRGVREGEIGMQVVFQGKTAWGLAIAETFSLSLPRSTCVQNECERATENGQCHVYPACILQSQGLDLCMG